ncbi:efflux RND transporter periplasmic adaptor subunit [Sphingomonas nostoxanthinifaciens]|uniref:efflux RND transporter periplasmic adaptor subunit n=1 Tax=Sphingomonas nostoxanthinifaciens TaxID=2872652 RepID=UPI001CC20F9C|nr:efflux RND transporter periplasmic adaptor subunit [Sphingomonas nostoxanthinifaciens]UAK25924.1 efflux RND transporter periplasmic adaptor subunit [Sphingomonas nostoxanthinifaciens]
MKRLSPALFLALAACGSASDPVATPSTAVSTVAPQQGDVTRWVSAYGSATPASNGTITLSVPQAGQVVKLAVSPGNTVHAGQPIVIFALAPSAQASFESASTLVATAKAQRATTARLLDQQLATRDQLAQADKALADAQAALAAAQREGAGQAMQTLRAPFDGIVTTIPVAQGDRTQPSALLATVARKGGIIVTIGLDPTERAVRVGQPARLRPLDGGAPIDGHVLRIDGQLNATTHLIDVDLTFPAGALLPGQALKADIAAGSMKGWIVPHAAVVTDENGAHVFQVAGGKARAVEVTVVQTAADRDVVTGKIDASQPLIVDGAYQVEEGGAVRRSK